MGRKEADTRAYFKWAGLGFEFAAVTGLFFYLGYLAEQRWGCEPWGMLMGGAVGFTGGLYHLVKQGMAMNRELNRPDDDEHDVNGTEPRP